MFEAAVRPARFADVHPSGRLRLDGIARYLQDLSADDTVDADLPRRDAWVVRRTVVEVTSFPRYLERLTLSTWCSGIGSHYAERRAQVIGDRGGRIEASSLWVSVDPTTGRPSRVSQDFLDCYGDRRRLVGPSPLACPTATLRPTSISPPGRCGSPTSTCGAT